MYVSGFLSLSTEWLLPNVACLLVSPILYLNPYIAHTCVCVCVPMDGRYRWPTTPHTYTFIRLRLLSIGVCVYPHVSMSDKTLLLYT